MLAVDQITVIQDALSNTGNNRLAGPQDDPEVWDTAFAAFNRAMRVLNVSHNWLFATKTEVLEGLVSPSPSAKYSRAFQPPAGSLHIVNVYAQPADFTGWPCTENAYSISDYEIVEGLICTNRTETLVAKFLAAPQVEATHALFAEVLTVMVEAYILRGINEDHAAADQREAKARLMADDAKARIDIQQPGRPMRRGTLAAIRNRRRC